MVGKIHVITHVVSLHHISLYHSGNSDCHMIYTSNHLKSAPMDDMTNARMACSAQSGRRVCKTSDGEGGGGGGERQGCVSIANAGEIAG